jgi:meckelin (transmembrane protein 67)
MVFNVVVYYRYIDDNLGQFVDLMSVANISCFIFDEEFHGFVKLVFYYSDTVMLYCAEAP